MLMSIVGNNYLPHAQTDRQTHTHTHTITHTHTPIVDLNEWQMVAD